MTYRSGDGCSMQPLGGRSLRLRSGAGVTREGGGALRAREIRGKRVGDPGPLTGREGRAVPNRGQGGRWVGPRGLDRSLVLRLASGQWIRDGQTVLVAGTVSRLLDELTLARGDGSYPKLIQRLARTWLLILDDWALASLSPGTTRSPPGPRRPLCRPWHLARQAGPGRGLARCRRRSHLRRRHPRPTPQQCAPDHLKGASMRRLYDSTKTDSTL